MSSYYTCDMCDCVLMNDRWHLKNSENYDLCGACYHELSPADQRRFEYCLNEHMGSMGGGYDEVELKEFSEDETPKVTPEEDFAEAHYGVASDDDRSEDSDSEGSLEDFICDEDEEEVHTLEDFLEPFPAIEMESRMVNILTNDTESDWSETEDEAEDRMVENHLRETAADRAEETETRENYEVIRVPNRAFGKRQIKPRLGNLFAFDASHQVTDDFDEE